MIVSVLGKKMLSMESETKYIILWGNGEWEGSHGPLEETIKRAKEAYWNYSHKSARIIAYTSLYYVRNEMVETTKE